MREGETITLHGLGCPAVRGSFGGTTDARCTCGGHTVTILRRLDAAPDPHPWANTPPECLTPTPPRAGGPEVDRGE